MSSSQQTAEQAAAEWEDMFAGGKMPYTEEPFPSVQAIIEKHLALAASELVAIDVGAGSGRAVRWMLQKLAFQTVVAIEPTKNGCQALRDVLTRYSPSGSARTIEDTAQHGLSGLVRERNLVGKADLILWDSVLSFLPEADRVPALADSLKLLRCGTGIIVVTAHPDEKPGDTDWVANLLRAAAAETDDSKTSDQPSGVSLEFLEANAVAPFKMTFDGEQIEAAFAVTVARVGSH